MISVIIPVLNESATVRDVVEFARRSPNVAEVIVIDDGSIDGTPELAKAGGARVITGTLMGKGSSFQDGLLAAQNDIVVFLDGDLSGLCPDLIGRLTAPLLDGGADFVKAKFTRAAGRVTVLTARPLLQTFFPELSWVEQPLGGIVAARRSLLQRLTFENDYGVDVGLLLDVVDLGAKIVQVDIGHIEHDHNPLEVLGDMATQVVRTILNRADRWGRLATDQIHEVQEIELRGQAELEVVVQKIGRPTRLALFDMDGTLLDGRFVVELARCTGKETELMQYLDHPTMPPESRSHEIARLFTGLDRAVFEQTARHMCLTSGAVEAVVGLRKFGYRVGLVTDSYSVASEVVRRRVFADFSVAHLMRFRGGKATGHLSVSPAMIHPQGCPLHPVCKSNVLKHLVERTDIDPTEVIAIGDSANDMCLFRAAGRSAAFQPKTESVRQAATVVLGNSLSDVLALTGITV